MDFASIVPLWLDAALMAPFRWPSSALLGMWLGSACLAAYCVVIGELCAAGLFLLHRRHFTGMQDGMVRYHNISVQALHAGDKETYLAANKMAREDFGKSFFAQAAAGMSSLWVVPFALAWMSLRFEGIELYRVPGTEKHAGYVFVFLVAYIALRIAFSRWAKPRLPLFRRIAAMKKQAAEARGAMRSLFV